MDVTPLADRYYADAAVAFARTRLGAGPCGPAEDLLPAADAAGLDLHHFKRTSPLPRVQRLLGALRGMAPASLVDVGIGRGAFLWPLLDALPDLRVIAVDHDPLERYADRLPGAADTLLVVEKRSSRIQSLGAPAERDQRSRSAALTASRSNASGPSFARLAHQAIVSASRHRTRSSSSGDRRPVAARFHLSRVDGCRYPAGGAASRSQHRRSPRPLPAEWWALGGAVKSGHVIGRLHRLEGDASLLGSYAQVGLGVRKGDREHLERQLLARQRSGDRQLVAFVLVVRGHVRSVGYLVEFLLDGQQLNHVNWAPDAFPVVRTALRELLQPGGEHQQVGPPGVIVWCPVAAFHLAEPLELDGFGGGLDKIVEPVWPRGIRLAVHCASAAEIIGRKSAMSSDRDAFTTGAALPQIVD